MLALYQGTASAVPFGGERFWALAPEGFGSQGLKPKPFSYAIRQDQGRALIQGNDFSDGRLTGCFTCFPARWL